MPLAIRLRRISTHSCCVQMPEEAEWLRAALATVFYKFLGSSCGFVVVMVEGF